MEGECPQPPASPQSTPRRTPDHNDAPTKNTNRLIDSTSPYLLQHAHNPVNWYPWGREALEKSRREDKPIFLSIGYSACHWCHVMEREVFEKNDIANIMNAHFINIKVDREERPDLDELYMLATQLMSGSGGWPMSVWLTPALEPFYAGTYFPPTDSYGRPGFPKLELALADAWKKRRGELISQSQRVVEAIKAHADESAPLAAPSSAIDLKSLLAGAIEQFQDRFDAEHGGLGSAPKFPPHQALRLWLALLRYPEAGGVSPAQSAALREMTTRTLDALMRGGIYDHVAGGFARYSTDERWLVPHFEKMLYDNAQLAPVYALASVQFGRPDYARVARQTLDFWLREMRSSDGALFSTLDADSDGAEGKYYVWTPAEIQAALPLADDADLLIQHFGVTNQGNWHESPVPGGSVLAIARTVEQLAAERGADADLLQKRIDGLLTRLRAFRAKRIPPALDDKIITSWNGLMISALAICGRILREPKYLEAAHRAIGFLLTHHVQEGRKLLRVSRNGKAHTEAFLEDHASLLNGLMDLIDSTTSTSLPGTMARKRSLELADTLIREFEDAQRGGFFFTAPARDELFAPMKNSADNAVPSANALAIRALFRLSRSSGKENYRDNALHAVAAFLPNIQRRPEYFPTILHALLEDAQARGNGIKPTLNVDGALGLSPAIPQQTALSDSTTPPGVAPKGTNPAPLLTLAAKTLPPLPAGSAFDVSIDLTIAHGHHIQPHVPADREAFATVARLRGDVPLATQEWTYPPADVPYTGQLRFIARCSLPKNARAGTYKLRATVLAQPCSGTTCFSPEKVSVDINLTVVTE